MIERQHVNKFTRVIEKERTSRYREALSHFLSLSLTNPHSLSLFQAAMTHLVRTRRILLLLLPLLQVNDVDDDDDDAQQCSDLHRSERRNSAAADAADTPTPTG